MRQRIVKIFGDCAGGAGVTALHETNQVDRCTINRTLMRTACCRIMAVGLEILKKTNLFGTDVAEPTLDTVRMFHLDATGAGFRL